MPRGFAVLHPCPHACAHKVGVLVFFFFAAHFVDDAETHIFQSHGLNTASVGSSCTASIHSIMGERAGQRVARHSHRRWAHG